MNLVKVSDSHWIDAGLVEAVYISHEYWVQLSIKGWDNDIVIAKHDAFEDAVKHAERIVGGHR